MDGWMDGWNIWCVCSSCVSFQPRFSSWSCCPASTAAAAESQNTRSPECSLYNLSEGLDRKQTPPVNQHPSFVFMWWPQFKTHGLYLQLNVYFLFQGLKNLGGNNKRGIVKERMATCFLDISSNEIKTGSTSRLSCQWNRYKSAEWHALSRFITRHDNESLCGSLFHLQKTHCGGI